jgi:hypothetical protein
MKRVICTVFLLLTISEMRGQSTTGPALFDTNAAERFANLRVSNGNFASKETGNHPLVHRAGAL